MPPYHQKSESICLWLTSFLLFVATATGGILLVLVILLPENNETKWFPVAGLFLVGTPWIFWALTAAYRWLSSFCSVGRSNDGDGGFDGGGKGGGELPEVAGRVALCKDLADEGGGGSPGGRKVRFGLATVVSSARGGKWPEGEAADGAMALDMLAGDASADHGLPAGFDESTGQGPSPVTSMSRECELPLTLAMSSCS